MPANINDVKLYIEIFNAQIEKSNVTLLDDGNGENINKFFLNIPILYKNSTFTSRTIEVKKVPEDKELIIKCICMSDITDEKSKVIKLRISNDNVYANYEDREFYTTPDIQNIIHNKTVVDTQKVIYVSENKEMYNQPSVSAPQSDVSNKRNINSSIPNSQLKSEKKKSEEEKSVEKKSDSHSESKEVEFFPVDKLEKIK